MLETRNQGFNLMCCVFINEERNMDLESIETLVREGEVRRASNILTKHPLEFAKSLELLLSNASNTKLQSIIVNQFNKVVKSVPTPLLEDVSSTFKQLSVESSIHPTICGEIYRLVDYELQTR